MPLLQEIYAPDTWKQLVCCILLNRTKRAQVDKIRDEFFRRYPGPEALVWNLNFEDLVSILKPLGFGVNRAMRLVGFSYDFINKPWGTEEEILKMTGIGRYAADSFRIFSLGEKDFIPTDKELARFLRGEST